MPDARETPSPPPGLIVAGAFRKGPRYFTYREYGSQDWLLIYTLSGQGRFGHANGKILTNPGDMILLTPNTRHDYGTARNGGHWELIWAHFIPRTDWLPWLEWPELAPGLLGLSLDQHDQQTRIVRRFRQLLQLATGPLRLREPLAMNALEEILLRCDLGNPQRESTRMDNRIRQSLDFIGEHLAEPLTVGHMAAHCGLSPSRFAHLFRAQIRETPQRYLELQRLRRARQLLEFTQEPVRQIAQQVGFDSPFYFSLRFKQHNGLSPRDWRQRQLTGQPE